MWAPRHEHFILELNGRIGKFKSDISLREESAARLALVLDSLLLVECRADEGASCGGRPLRNVKRLIQIDGRAHYSHGGAA